MVEQGEQDGATGGAAPATAADIGSLQRQIEQLGTAVGQATVGLNLYRSEEDIVERVRKRFIYALGIVAVLSFFGIQAIAYVIIDQQWGKELKDRITDATVAVTKAQMSTAQASKAATDANDAVKKAKSNLDAAVLASQVATAKATKAAEDARRKAEAVTGRFDEIDQRLKEAAAKVQSEIAGASASVRAAADKSISDVLKQLVNIQDQINAVSSKANVNVADLQTEQQNLRNETESERKKYSENSLFSVWLFPVGREFKDDAKKLSREITRKGGFKGGTIPNYFAEQSVTDIELPIGANRSNDKIATIMTSPDDTDSMDRIPEIQDILEEALPGFLVRRNVAFGMEPIRGGVVVTNSSERPYIYVFLSNWPIGVIERTED